MFDKIVPPDLSPSAPPPTAFNFLVVFLGIDLKLNTNVPVDTSIPAPNLFDLRFQRVSGIGMTVPTQTKTNQGNQSLQLPQWPEYDKLVLERGFVVGLSPLKKELEFTLQNLQFQQKDILIMLLNGSGIPVVSWLFFGAYPTRWTIGDLDANQSRLLIETIEFSYKRFQSISI